MGPSFWSSLSPEVQFLLGMGARGALLLAVAWVLYTLLLRRAPTAHRHALLVLCAAGLVLMLAVQVLAPPLHLRLLAAPEAESAQEPAPRELAGAPGVSVERGAVEARGLMDRMDDMDGAAGAVQGSSQFPWERFFAAVPGAVRAAPVLTVYLLGLPLLLAQLGAGLLGLWRLRRGAQPAPAYLLAVFEETWKRHPGQSVKDAESTRVRLCVGAVPVPMTWGWRRPVIMLPAAGADWDEERLRVVFLHELAHIRRADFLTLLLTRVAVALHWPNPLAWWLLRAVRRESEAACDEAVLRSGVRASDYAAHLLGVVEALRTAPPQRTAAVAMAHTPHLAQRLEHICAVPARLRWSPWKIALPAGVLLACCLTLAAPVALEARAGQEAFLQDPYSLTLPDGAALRVLGVQRMGSSAWWQANGAPLHEPPEHTGSSWLDPPPGMEAYTVVLRLDPPDGHEPFLGMHELRVQPVLPEGLVTGGGAGGGHMPGSIYWLSLSWALPAELTKLDLRVLYPAGDWNVVHEVNATGGAMVSGDPGTVMFSGLFETGEGVFIVVTDQTPEPERPVRIVAVTREGSEVPGTLHAGGGTSNLRQRTYGFPQLEKADIEQLRYETRDFVSYNIANIQLRPDELAGEIRDVRLRPPGEALSEEVSAEEGLQHLGLALKKYTLESRERSFPPKAAGLPGFTVDWQALDPYLDDELRQFKESATADRLVYLGHVVRGEDDLRALLDAYLEKGEEAVREKDVRIGAADTPGSIFFRLREGIERFFITDINNPAASAVQQHTIPVAWVWPEEGRNGGFVLYMDGLVRGLSWGAFPMTDAAVEAFKEFEAARK